MPLPLDKLTAELSPASQIITDFANHPEYLTDATPNVGSASAVVLAACEEDVVKTVNYGVAFNTPIVPRGAGTGLSGGCVPHDNSIVLSTQRINYHEIKADRRLAICGPGCITKDLMDAAREYGLTYLPDPASYEESSLGGNIAENAGGLRCKRYGVTRDYALGLRAVLADGSLLKTGCYSNSNTFNLNDLLIGSEGTLAIVTEITLELSPIPTRGCTILASFESAEGGGNTVADIILAGIVPTVLEFIDGDAAACSNQYEKNDGLENAGSILLIETDGDKDPEQLNRVKTICKNNQAVQLKTEPDSKLAEDLWRVRRNLSNAAKAAAELRLSEDVAVPVSRFSELVAWVAAENKSSGLRINSFGHAGDGNLHVNYLATTDDTINRDLIQKHVARLMHKTIELGGTISGEHGIGLEKREYLGLEFDRPTLELMKSLKRIFDPAGLLNPNKIF